MRNVLEGKNTVLVKNDSDTGEMYSSFSHLRPLETKGSIVRLMSREVDEGCLHFFVVESGERGAWDERGYGKSQSQRYEGRRKIRLTWAFARLGGVEFEG
jgi:hypothetical protein